MGKSGFVSQHSKYKNAYTTPQSCAAYELSHSLNVQFCFSSSTSWLQAILLKNTHCKIDFMCA